jgi:hypothetical protein
MQANLTRQLKAFIASLVQKLISYLFVEPNNPNPKQFNSSLLVSRRAWKRWAYRR